MNLQQNSKNKNIINLHRASVTLMGYHLRTNVVKNEKGDVANPDRVLVVRMNQFSELMNAPGVNGVRRDEINKAGRLVADPSAFEFVMATEAKRDTNHQVLNFHADYFNTYTVHLLLLFITAYN